MKYVFIVHSHTSFLSSLGTIDYLSLDMKQVILLYARNYKNSLFTLDCQIIDVNELYSQIKNAGKQIFFNKKTRTDLICQVDKFVEDCIKEEYEVFLPYIGFPFFQLLYTNPKCCRMSYVQEGGIPFKSAYSTDYPFLKRIAYGIFNHFLLKGKRLFVPPKWYLKEIFYKQDNIDAYAISEDFFRYLPADCHIIKWPNKKLDYNIASDSPVFVFDGFVSNYHIESDFYLENCRQLIKKEAARANYIKFHPAQSEKEKEKILSFFKDQGKEASILNNDIPFEIILSSSSDLTIVGFGSSLLYFAADLHHKVRNYEEWLCGSPLYNYYKKHS